MWRNIGAVALAACSAVASTEGDFAEVASHRPLLKGRQATRRTEAMECMSDVDLIEPAIGSTYPMYLENREKVLAALDAPEGSLIVMTGDKLEMRTGSDTEILFRQASEVWYLANVDRYDVSLAIDTSTGGTTILVKRQTTAEDTFNGKIPPFEELAVTHDVDRAAYTTDLESIVSNYNGTIYTVDETELMAQYPFIADANMVDSTSLRRALNTARAIKSDYELTMLRHASQVAADAHMKAWAATTLTEPLNNEFVVENAFLSACYSCGLRFQAYIPIVASGGNSAVLHYNRNDRSFVDGDLMLIDAAPETKGYTSDVTRTYPVNGRYTADQKLVYEIVLDAQKAAIEVFVPGATWAFVSAVANQELTRGLLEAGFIQGDFDTLYSRRVYGTFMPHGLGHSVGLDVHDVPYSGGAVKGHVYTIEPGIYFIDSLLDDALSGSNAEYYNADMIARFRGFGGIRIEDVIAVTADGNECLSCTTPRETEEIEAILNQIGDCASFSPTEVGIAAGVSKEWCNSNCIPHNELHPACDATQGAQLCECMR